MEKSSLTRAEAIQALREGKKVTHRFFSYNEWMKLVTGDLIRFEDGVHMTLGEFFSNRNEQEWNDGYSIYGTQNN
jgi:hypothetical protein